MGLFLYAIGMFKSRVKALKDITKKITAKTLEVIKENDNVVIDDITDKQLFEKGEDGKGISLGEYSPVTIDIKRGKGQRVDHITLRDTGDYYSSHRTSLTAQGLLVTAETDKGENDLAQDFGKAILIWSDENQDNFIKDILLDELIIFEKEII